MRVCVEVGEGVVVEAPVGVCEGDAVTDALGVELWVGVEVWEPVKVGVLVGKVVLVIVGVSVGVGVLVRTERREKNEYGVAKRTAALPALQKP